MIIKILGTGCSNCVRLEKNVQIAVLASGIDAKIVKVTKIEDIMAYGVMSSPALVIDDEVKSYGKVNSVDEIKKMIKQDN